MLSNVSPVLTFQHLCDAQHLPHDFLHAVQHIDSTSPVTKINLTMSRLPNFSCMPHTSMNEAGPQHRGTIHFVENSSQIEDAYLDALQGRISTRPVIEMTIPSSLDPTLTANKEHHVASLFTQYTPYDIQGGWTDAACAAYAARCFSVIEEYCPGFTASIMHYEVLPPPILERIFGLSGGNIFHAAMGLDQLYWLRPTVGWSQYRTPIHGLYLCGAGTHPGQPATAIHSIHTQHHWIKDCILTPDVASYLMHYFVILCFVLLSLA